MLLTVEKVAAGFVGGVLCATVYFLAPPLLKAPAPTPAKAAPIPYMLYENQSDASAANRFIRAFRECQQAAKVLDASGVSVSYRWTNPDRYRWSEGTLSSGCDPASYPVLATDIEVKP